MKKNDLYDLVRSLTKSKKRHFKLQSQRQGGGGGYLRLFEILEKQVVFDEKVLQNWGSFLTVFQVFVIN